MKGWREDEESSTGISSQLGAKLRDWADRQAEAPLSSNDSKNQ